MPLTPPQTLALYSWQRDDALNRLRVFRDQMLDRILPTFANIEQEARAHGESIFQAGLSKPSYGEGDESGRRKRRRPPPRSITPTWSRRCTR
jgi:hypothetical protein